MSYPLRNLKLVDKVQEKEFKRGISSFFYKDRASFVKQEAGL